MGGWIHPTTTLGTAIPMIDTESLPPGKPTAATTPHLGAAPTPAPLSLRALTPRPLARTGGRWASIFSHGSHQELAMRIPHRHLTPFTEQPNQHTSHTTHETQPTNQSDI